MTATEIDRAITDLARRQHGVFHRSQVLERGATRRMIDRRRDTGRWIALAPHVYALPGNPATWHRQAKAAELSVPGSGLSGRSAAALHGLGEVRAGRLEVTVGRDGLRSSPLAIVRRRDGVAHTTVSGIRVTTVAQTLGDLSGQVPILQLEGCIDDALVRSLVDVDRLVEHHRTMVTRRSKGAAILGDLLDDRATGHVPPSSVLEAALYRMLDDPRIPAVVRQHDFAWRDGRAHIVDAFIPSWGRIIEADGRLYHARLADFERDKARDHAAQMHGIETTRFTYRQVLDGSYALDVLLAIGGARYLAA